MLIKTEAWLEKTKESMTFYIFLEQIDFFDKYMNVIFIIITKITHRLYCKTENNNLSVPKRAYASDIFLNKREKWLLRNPKLLISQKPAEISTEISIK